MTVQWIVQNDAPTSATQSTEIDLSAKLSGPYADVSSLKQREVTRARSIAAVPIVTSDWAGGAPPSRLLILATAAPGFYDLSMAVKSARMTPGGAGIVASRRPGTPDRLPQRPLRPGKHGFSVMSLPGGRNPS
jgi:hypothetical protein